MPKIEIRELWNQDILCSDQFGDLLSKTFDDRGLLPWPKVKLGDNDPPIFLYQESRGEDKYVNAFSFYGGKGDGAQSGGGARSELRLGKIISTKERGEILSFFCKFEFILEVLVCILEGVYSNEIKYKKLRRQFEDENGSFSTVQRKLNYLEDFQILSPQTTTLLKKAKKIRNVLSHQYLPQKNIGLRAEEVELYESIGEAIGSIYTAAWFYLLKDYVIQQDEIAEWLVTKHITDTQPPRGNQFDRNTLKQVS